jgi:hypothetical protein
MPGPADHGTQSWIATGLILAVVLILSFGGTIERMLETFAWIMLGVVFLFLILVRTTADAVWMSHPRVHSGVGIRAVYYGILALFSVFGALAIRTAAPFQLFKVLANMAGLVLVIAGVQILRVNRRFLSQAVRPPLWREAALALCVAFYAFFSWFGLRDVLRGLFG